MRGLAMAESHGTREFIEKKCCIPKLRRKPIGGANRLRQICEYRQCEILPWLNYTEQVTS